MINELVDLPNVGPATIAAKLNEVIRALNANVLDTTPNTGSPKFSEESKEFIGKLFRSQIDLPPDVAEAVNEHFWDLL